MFDPTFNISKYPTCGPKNRFSAVLFIEKEGFNPLFKEVKLAERYDLAIMSCKGQSVVAARRLVDELCGIDSGVPLLVLHDLDKEGFLISQTLTSVSLAAEEADRVRYQFENEINVIDLGLRLNDVKKWKLESESVRFKGGFDLDSIATPDEQAFLRSNRRVELNAFASADFIVWIEAKLKQHGITKLIPDAETLEDAYRRAYQIAELNRQIELLTEDADEKAKLAGIPKTLAKLVRAALKANPAKPWDQAVADIANGQIWVAADDE